MARGPHGIDFAATAEEAAGKTTRALEGALIDILATLPYADAMDREMPRADGRSRGGEYRDESSVYRKELARRRELGTIEEIAGEEDEG